MPDVEKILQNNSRASCWIVIEKQVYDVTDFLDEHPGRTILHRDDKPIVNRSDHQKHQAARA